MKIKLNGEIQEFESALTIVELLEYLHLNRDGIAVAVNRSVVPREDHATTLLQEGDAVEVIHAVGGGS